MYRNCPNCPGQAYELGGLGNLKHYRCRDCGIQFSVKIKTDRRKARERRQARELKRIHQFGTE